MHYQPITSFRRAMDAACVPHPASQAPAPIHAIDKWDILRELAVARANFGLSDRDLAVLQALLSFHPGTKLDDPARLVVFPSNATLCARLNGMPCSTMRRHLSRLIESGVILRRDSPNGKRYRRREGPAFGFDLAPLVNLAGQISRMAAQIRAEQQRMALLREEISLLRRDLTALLHTGAPPDLGALLDLSARVMRRKLTLEQMLALHSALTSAVDNLAPPAPVAADPGSSDNQNEQHQYTPDKKNPDSDPCTEPGCGNDLQFHEVMQACDQIQSFAQEPITDWRSLVQAAEALRPMMDICQSAWQQAVQQMGRVTAAVTLAAILQRYGDIRAPGAYLRDLAAKAARQEFSPARLIRGLGGKKFTAVNPQP